MLSSTNCRMQAVPNVYQRRPAGMACTAGAVVLLLLVLELSVGVMAVVNTSTKARNTMTASPTEQSVSTSVNSASLSNSVTQSATATLSMSQSVSMSSSQEASISRSGSASLTMSPEPASGSKSVTASTSHSFSQQKSFSTSKSASASKSITRDATSSLSPSEVISTTKTQTITPPPTPSRTRRMTVTMTALLTGSTTDDITVSVESATPSGSHSVSDSDALSRSLFTPSRSVSVSNTPTSSPEPSLTLTPGKSPTATNRVTDTLNSLTMTLSKEVTSSKTRTLRLSPSISVSVTITQRLTISVQPPTSTHIPTPTKTLITACPLCNHGTCTDRPPYVCQCFLSYKLGFWAGGEVQGATCSQCVANFYGSSCKNSCPGGVCTPCNNHGVCDDGVTGTGKCTCFSNVSLGMWIGDSCDRCASGFFGADCKGVCNCDADKGVCQEGVTGSGSCLCNAGRSGARCESCSSGFYLAGGGGSTCVQCPGYSSATGLACNGHGSCDPSSGICYCNGLYTQSSNCLLTDPNAVNGCDARCATNNGTCLYGTCRCPFGSLGTYCEARCPFVTQTTANATTGQAVQSQVLCANHGTCYYDSTHSSANCSCYANTSFGFYDVATNCSTCLQGYGGAGCQAACPVNSALFGGTCNYLNINASLNMTVSVLCNQSTGTCNCPPGYCGADCTPSTRPDRECLCLDVRQFGVDCNSTCVNGTAFNFKNSSGRCDCNAGFVGTSCDIQCSCVSNTFGTCPYQNDTCVCVAGRAGPTCSIVCPKNPSNNLTCSSNGNCNEGNTGDGRCVCNDGFVGESCQTVCQCVNSTLGSCQSDGKCVCALSTWRVGDDCGSCEDGRSEYDCRTQCVHGNTSGIQCICLPTYGGSGCNAQCPSSPSGVLCSGNGNCSEGNLGTGACVCFPGYQGPSCNCTDDGCIASRGDNSACNALTGTCDCVLPFGGDDCSTCATGYWGYSCRNVCPCIHGTCHRVTGACTCYTDEQNGFWTGSLCSSCLSGYNLPDCIQIVSVSTQIASFQSVYLKGKLFYTAKKLHIFEEYDIAIAIGPITAVYGNISQSLPTLLYQVNFASQVAFSDTACEYGHSWVAPRSPSLVVDNATNTRSTTYNDGSPGGSSVFILQLCLLPAGATTYTMIVQEYPLLPTSAFFSPAQLNAQRQPNATFNISIPQLVALVSMRRFVYRSVDYLAAAVTVELDGNSVNALYSVNFGASARVLQRQRSSFALSENLEATLSTMVAVLYDPMEEHVLVVGIFDASGVSTAAQKLRSGSYILTFSPVAAGVTVRVFLNQYSLCTFASLTLVNHTAEALLPNPRAGISSTSPVPISVIVMMQVTNGTQDFIRVNLTSGSSTISYPSRTLLASADLVVATVYDPLTSMLWIVSNNGKTFKIIKAFLCSSQYVTSDGFGVETIGSQLLPAITGVDRRIVDMRPSFTSRQLHLFQLNASGTVIRRFLLYENLNIFPRTASRLSSPLITVTGRGFLSGTESTFFPGNYPRCRVTSGTTKYQVPASLASGSSTQFVCALDASNTSLCAADIVEVAVFDQFFTTSSLSIPRFQQPQISSVSPATTPLQSSTGTLPAITLLGSGFVDSGILRCRFTPQNISDWASYTTNGTFVSTAQIRCEPPVLVRAVRLYVNVACDGNIFTEDGNDAANLIAVVGAPYNITTTVTSLSVNSAQRVAIPVISVSFVDDQGSSLVATVSERIQVQASFLGGLVAQGELVLVNNVGVFTFASMQLLSPVDETGTGLVFTATLLSGDPRQWSARIPITINSGDPSSLWLTNSPSVESGIPETNRISVVEATVVDYAGNRVKSLGSATSNATTNATISLHFIVAPNVELPEELFKLYPADDFSNISQALEGGVVTFTTLEISNARGGLIIWFLVETDLVNANGDRLVNQTAQLIPKCNAGKLRFIGDTTCRTCPSNMKCPDNTRVDVDNGNSTLLVTVDSGYYRSTVYATDAVACQPSFACVGGLGTGACAEGYAGALCGLCEETSYGRSIIGGDCVACYDSRVSGFLLFLVILIICVAFVVLTIGAVQNWAVTMEPAVSLVLLVQHLHSILGIGLTGFNFSLFFKNAMSYLGIFSTRVLDYFFADCVLVGEGMTFYNKIVAYAIMPALALFLASVAWLVVFISPRLLRFERLQVEREQALNARRDELLRRLTKYQQHRRTAGALTSRGGARNRAGNNLPNESPAERLRRITDQAELTTIEHELKHNLKAQGVLPLNDYRILASHSLQVIMVFTFHSIIYYALTVFNCQEVSSGLGTVQSFLETDNRISCDSAEYHQYVGFGYLISILYFLLVPVLYLVLYKAHLRHRPAKVLQRRQVFYVLTIGLKTGSWYWPAIILLRKGIQFAVAAAVSSPADAHVSVWLFALQLIWLLNLKPYWNWSNTFLEAVSLVSCIIAGSLCILFEAYTTDESRDAISGAILGVMLVPVPLFFVSATQKVWRSVREEIRALRQESEEESSSESDHGGDRGDAHDANNKLFVEAPLSPLPRSENDKSTPAPTSKRLLRTVSIPKFFRVEEDARMKREDQQRSRELETNLPGRRAAFAQQQQGSFVRRGGLDAPLLQSVRREREGADDDDDEHDERRVKQAPPAFRDMGNDNGYDSDRSSNYDDNDIPALVPASMAGAVERSRNLRRQMRRRGAGHEDDDSDEDLMSDSTDKSAEGADGSTHRRQQGGGPAMLDATARLVFERQLKHDEATRRERAFDDLMALEHERNGGGGDGVFRDDMFAVL